MSHEFPQSFGSEFEKKPDTPKRIAGSRASKAIMFAAGMAVLGSSEEAEARKKRTPVAAEVMSANAHGSEKTYPSLSSRKDHGLEKEVDAAEHFGLKNFKTVEEIEKALKDGKLVELMPGEEDTYALDSGIGELVEEEYRHFFHCVLPYVQERLESLSSQFYSKFKTKLIVSSAVRTEKYQDRLRRGNSNAAQGYTSSHLKGSTIDIMYFAPENSRRMSEYRMTREQQEWLDARLLMMEMDGMAQVTKEKQQPVYHVMFYPEKYKK